MNRIPTFNELINSQYKHKHCEYCGSIFDHQKNKCNNCGAPRTKKSEKRVIPITQPSDRACF